MYCDMVMRKLFTFLYKYKNSNAMSLTNKRCPYINTKNDVGSEATIYFTRGFCPSVLLRGNVVFSAAIYDRQQRVSLFH